MRADGLDVAVLDMDPDKPMPGSGDKDSEVSPGVVVQPRSQLPLPQVPPKKRLKPLFWEKVEKTNGSSGSKNIWQTLSNQDEAKVDEEDTKLIFDAFSITSSAAELERSVDTKESVPVPGSAEILRPKKNYFSAFDPKRGHILSIVTKKLSKLVQAQDLHEALSFMDAGAISVEIVDLVSKFVPTQEEMHKLHSREDSSEEMDHPTEYMVRLCLFAY